MDEIQKPKKGRPPKKERMIQRTLKFPPSMWKELEEIATSKGNEVSSLIRDYCSEGIKKDKG